MVCGGATVEVVLGSAEAAVEAADGQEAANGCEAADELNGADVFSAVQPWLVAHTVEIEAAHAELTEWGRALLLRALRTPAEGHVPTAVDSYTRALRANLRVAHEAPLEGAESIDALHAVAHEAPLEGAESIDALHAVLRERPAVAAQLRRLRALVQAGTAPTRCWPGIRTALREIPRPSRSGCPILFRTFLDLPDYPWNHNPNPKPTHNTRITRSPHPPNHGLRADAL
jgi:hypothetical protein